MRKGTFSRRSAGHVPLIFTSFFAVSIFAWIPLPLAQGIKMSGGLTTSYERYDRWYEKEGGNEQVGEGRGEVATTAPVVALTEKYNRFRISPMIVLASVSAREELSIQYTPSFRYDYETYNHDVDHDLSARIKQSITSKWLLRLNERFLLTDKSSDQATTGTADTVNLSDTTKRRKYWTNNLGVVSEYGYWQDSLFSLGYTFGNLRNFDVESDSDFEDYDRHSGSASVGHRFDAIWKLTVSSSYVRGLYDNTSLKDTADADAANLNQDLSEYRAATVLESRFIEHNPLSLAYNYLGVDYDAAERQNQALHDMTLGWQWEISKFFSMNLGAGPSYQESAGQDGTWGYNANAKLKYALERGSVEASANRGYDVQNFTGTGENGRREFWQSRLAFNYEMLQDLSLKMFTQYRYEDQEDITGQTVMSTDSETATEDDQIVIEKDTFNRKRFGAGTSFGYLFSRWYTVNLSYDCLFQDSEKVHDTYDEHRLVLSLSMKKDLLSW